MSITPSPLLIPNRPRARLTTDALDADEQRSCTSKVTHLNEETASVAALERMFRTATKPLSAYPCDHCFGYHLTSAAVRDTHIDPLTFFPKAVSQTPLTPVRKKRPTSGHRNNRRKPLTYTYDKYERIDQTSEAREGFLPVPQVATTEAVEAFFSEHQ